MTSYVLRADTTPAVAFAEAVAENACRRHLSHTSSASTPSREIERCDRSDSRNSREQQEHSFRKEGREQIPSCTARPQANARRTFCQEYSRQNGSESRQARRTDSGTIASRRSSMGACHAHWYSATTSRTVSS